MQRALGKKLAAAHLGRSRESNLTSVSLWLRGVPPTALPADIRRMAERVNIHGGFQVQLEYYKYRPTGRALMTLSTTEEADDAILRLSAAQISGQNVYCKLAEEMPRVSDSTFPGSGLNAGVKERGRTVLLEGLPRMTSARLRDALLGEHFHSDDVPNFVIPVETAREGYRWLVQLESVAEAHRLVRKYHMTAVDNTKLLVHARIIH